MDVIQKARGKLMITQPFFATLLMSLDAVETDTVPTLATDMKKIYYNRQFVEEHLKTPELIMAAFAHEVMHVCLEHGLRRGARNPVLWNIAGDFAINYILKDSGFTLGEGWLYDPSLKGMSADQIYDKLQKMAEEQRKKGGSGKPGEGGMPGFDDLHGGKDGEGDLKQPEGGMSQAEQAEARRHIQQKVAQAANVARLAGKLPGALEELIGEILDPKVPWIDLLRDYMLRVVHEDESWGRRNRRFQSVYLPGRHSEEMGPIVIIGDSSGSIWCSPEELAQFAGEISAIADQMRPENIRLIWADTKVAGEEVFERGDPLKFNVKGGGGTDMCVPLKYVEQYEPEIVVLLTDGYTPWPREEPPYPLIVCCSTDAACPVGQVVRMNK